MAIHKQHPNLRQLWQLRRLDPEAACAAEIALAANLPNLAIHKIRQGMQQALTRLAQQQNTQANDKPISPPVDVQIFEAVQEFVNNPTPIAPGKQVKIWQGERLSAWLWRTRDNTLRLVIRGANGELLVSHTASALVGRWGRDCTQQSSAYAGKWVMVAEAHQNIKQALTCKSERN